MSVIDLIAQGVITNNRIGVSNQLIDTFNKHWDILSSGTYQGKDNLHLPFFYLQSEGFWHIESKNNSLKRVPSSVKKLKEVVEYASLDPELFELLQDQNYRKELTSKYGLNSPPSYGERIGLGLKSPSQFQPSSNFGLPSSFV
ncbi:MAG: hypothetical protein SWX82_22820 [Cyanobacteriota bacterium]|nr:hypothetical protein [Cyanobacteriota bacterium]